MKNKMTELKIFKIEYYWYEGEHEAILLAKDVEREQFENDLLGARKFAEKLKGKKIKDDDYLGKGYTTECLPEFYEQIIFFLKEESGYIECDFSDRISYIVNDDMDKMMGITKSEKIVKRNTLE